MLRSYRYAIILTFCFLLAVVACTEKVAAQQIVGPWNVSKLKQTPLATWGKKDGLLQQVYYEGEPLQGKPTRVFAYVALPENVDTPVPGMVLIHGGGGKAFPQWATLWAKRGYAAIAMDLGGCGPDGQRHADAMPPQNVTGKFPDFADNEPQVAWSYHAVAAIVRAHSLLRSLKQVDAERTGVTGISWGGYLTSIVSGVDDRFKLAVPVYGCGFLHHNSAWIPRFEIMGSELSARWIRFFEPSQYLPRAKCPMLFVNGTNDHFYPMDSHRKSYRAVQGPVTLCIRVRMPHGHGVGWDPKEIGFYADSILCNGDPLPQLGELQAADGVATASFQSKTPVVKGQLHFTTDVGDWEKRQWQSVDAQVSSGRVSVKLPSQRPLTYYLSVTDERDAMVNTTYGELR